MTLGKMSKQMEHIYVVMTCEKLETKNGFPDFGSTSIIGWFSKFKDAENRVINNVCDIWETCYDYAIIEESISGLYTYSKTRWFYKYNRATGLYEEIKEPSEYKKFVGLIMK